MNAQDIMYNRINKCVLNFTSLLKKIPLTANNINIKSKCKNTDNSIKHLKSA